MRYLRYRGRPSALTFFFFFGRLTWAVATGNRPALSVQPVVALYGTSRDKMHLRTPRRAVWDSSTQVQRRLILRKYPLKPNISYASRLVSHLRCVGFSTMLRKHA